MAGRMTIMLSKFKENMTLDGVPNSSDGMDAFVKELGSMTKKVHFNCATLFNKMNSQKNEFVPISENDKRELAEAARQAKTLSETLASSLFPHLEKLFFFLLMEYYQQLSTEDVPPYLLLILQVLMKFQRPPTDAEIAQVQELYNKVKGVLYNCVSHLKRYEQEKQEDQFVTLFSPENMAQFIILCKETNEYLQTLFAVAAHQDPTLLTPEDAEEKFLTVAGKLLANVKTICKYCREGRLRVKEEALVDQSTRMINSAKLLFRTRSQDATDLFLADKDALKDSVVDVVKELSERKRQGTLTQPPAPEPDPVSQTPTEEVMFMRGKIVEEILGTEAKYCSSLGITKLLYMSNMKTAKWLKDSEYTSLFTNLETIMSINSQLSVALQKKVKETKEPSAALLGQLFIEKAPEFLNYADYVNNFDEALKVLEQLQQRPKAQAFFHQLISENSKEEKLLDLGAYLIMPVQRLPRYELLLKELLKYTPKVHPDHPHVEESITQIKLVNAKINELKRQDENRLNWKRIRESFTTELSIPEAERPRWLIYEGVHEVVIVKGGKVKKPLKMQIFLFDEMIIFALEQRRRKYSVKHFVPFDNTSTAQTPKVASGPDPEVVIFTSFDTGDSLEFNIACASIDDKQKLKQQLSGALSATFS